MADLFGNPTKRELIWDIYTTLGSEASFRDLAKSCIQAGVWDETQQSLVMEQWATDKVAAALRETDIETGLPRSCQTGRKNGRGEPTHLPRVVAGYEEQAYDLLDRYAGIEADAKVVRRIRRSMVRQFGHAPDLPSLFFEDDLLVMDEGDSAGSSAVV